MAHHLTYVSDSSHEEKYEELSGTKNEVSSDEVLEEDKSYNKKSVKHKKEKVKWEAYQPPDAPNIPFADINLDEHSDPIAFFATFSLVKFCNIFALKATNMLYKLILKKPLLVTKHELGQFAGILFMMPIMKMPSGKCYWELETRYDNFADVMSHNRHSKSNDLFIAMTI